MKLSTYSLNYGTGGRMADVLSFLATCRALGLEGASLHLRDLPATTPEVLAKVRREMLDQGLSLSMVTVSTNFGVAENRQAAELARAREAIVGASVLGAPVLRVFAGSTNTEADRPAAWARAVAAVRQVCVDAEKAAIPVGLQNHNHGGLVATGEQVLRFVKEVNHPNLTAVLDCGQFLGSPGASGAKADDKAAELYESIRLVAPLARHVRVKFYRPARDGSEPGIDYGKVLDILRSVHYPGFLDIVYEPGRAGGEPIKTAMPRVVAFLRSQLRGDAAGAARAGAGRYEGLDASTVLADEAFKTETEVAFLEGPTVHPSGVVYFSNVKAERIMTWDPARKRLGVFRENSGAANGLIFDRQGRLVACEGSGRVTRLDLASGQLSVLAEHYNGQPFGAPNDVDIDGQGRIYFTSRLGSREPKPGGNVNAVYRIDPDGSLARIVAAPEIDMPNGLAVAPGDSTLYLIDADGRAGRARKVRAYDLKPDGSLANGRTVYDFAPGRSGDGMAVDAEGNLYVAAGLHRSRGPGETLDTRPGLHVISPRGSSLPSSRPPKTSSPTSRSAVPTARPCTSPAASSC